MSTLILFLPPGTVAEPAEYPFVLTADGHTATRQGTAPAALLPQPSGAGASIVVMVPARQLSWHRVDLPRTGAGPRLRAVLDGLLEDRLLDEPQSLHFALAPGARPGGPAWVAVCDRSWLRASLAALESAGRAVARIVPEFAPALEPDPVPRAHAIGSGPGDAWLVLDGGAAGTLASGVAVLPLTLVTAAGLRDPQASPQVTAEPGVAALAERCLGRSLVLQTAAERWLEAVRGPWDLAQFDLARSGRGRAWRRAGGAVAQFLRAPQWRAARWGAGLLVAAQIAGLNAWAWQERSSIAAKRARIDRILTETFPTVRAVLDAPLQMEREVAVLRQAAGALSGRDLESLLGTLAAVAPPFSGGVTAIDYSAGEARLRGRGLALDAETAARLSQAGTAARTEGDALVLRAQALPETQP